MLKYSLDVSKGLQIKNANIQFFPKAPIKNHRTVGGMTIFDNILALFTNN